MKRLKIAHLTTTDASLELLLGPQLQAMVQAGHDVIGISAAGNYTEKLRSRGVSHIPLKNSTRSISIKSDIKAAVELKSIIATLKPDVLHTHNPKTGIYGRYVGKYLRVPAVVNTVHGLYATENDSLLKRALVYTLERTAAMCSDGELIQNPEDYELLKKLGFPKRKLHLLGNGVDLKRFMRDDGVSEQNRAVIRKSLGISDDKIVVGTVGRLVREKGFGELFESARRLQANHLNVVFLVVGPEEPDKADGLTKEELRAATTLGIKLLGHRNDVQDIYPAMDIFVLPSYREGFPRSAMEAAAAGLPLVLTDIRGCRQVVEHCVNGFLVQRKDNVSLHDALEKLVLDSKLRLTFGQKSLEKAIREFDQENQIKITMDLYEALLDDK